VHGVKDRPVIGNVERQLRSVHGHVNYGFTDCVAATQFVVDVRVTARKIRNDQVRAFQKFNDLRGDPARFRELVGADWRVVAEVVSARGHDVLHENRSGAGCGPGNTAPKRAQPIK
jgi:hypothetical protein